MYVYLQMVLPELICKELYLIRFYRQMLHRSYILRNTETNLSVFQVHMI